MYQYSAHKASENSLWTGIEKKHPSRKRRERPFAATRWPLSGTVYAAQLRKRQPCLPLRRFP